MDSTKTDDQLTIVNRSTEYRISKQLIRKIPYFEKMLSHDLKESKENKVILDFDEAAFKWFLNWITFDHLLIEIKNVINLCTMIDYFGMDNNLFNDYATYFHDYFSTRHLPVVIPQVTSTSKCINSGALNTFICRHFLKIANTTVWLNYPIQTIEYICALDLMIHSEMQVFNAIIKWVNFKADSRKDYLERLLKLIRWCHLSRNDLSKIMENNFIKSSNHKPIFCTPVQCNGDCTFNRMNQYFYVLIEESDGTDLQIKVLDKNFMSFINRIIKLDESMPLYLLHNEHVSDIVFDSGGQMIRVDWNQNKYRLLGLNDCKSHYCKIEECILEKNNSDREKSEKNVLVSYSILGISHYNIESSPLEFNETFGWIAEAIQSILPMSNCEYDLDSGYADYTIDLCYWTAPVNFGIFFRRSEINYLITILENNIYIITPCIEMIQFNIDSQKTKKFTLKGRWKFDDSILTSLPAHDDKVFLIHKSKKIVECFNVNDEEWTPFGLLANNFSSTDQKKVNKLLTLTSAFIPINIIRSCINRECK